MNRADSGKQAAFERAGLLFEETVHQHANGDVVTVEVGHVQVADELHTGGFRVDPLAFIDGKSAVDVFLDTAATEDAYTDEELVNGAHRFNQLMSLHWERTVEQYTDELPAFVVALDGLARTVFRDSLFNDTTAEGVDDLMGLTEAMIYERALQNAVRDLQSRQKATVTSAE
jgi:hypothetical protein